MKERPRPARRAPRRSAAALPRVGRPLRRLDLLDLSRDQAVRTEVYDAVEGVLADYDLLVTPTSPCCRPEPGRRRRGLPRSTASRDPLIGWCLTYVTNFSGHPSCSIPAGLVDGLPVGMQIIGRRNADADVLAASAAFERLAGRRRTRPPPARRGGQRVGVASCPGRADRAAPQRRDGRRAHPRVGAQAAPEASGRRRLAATWGPCRAPCRIADRSGGGSVGAASMRPVAVAGPRHSRRRAG